MVIGCVAGRDDKKAASDDAVLPTAAGQHDVEDCVAVDGDSLKGIGQLVGANIGECGVKDIVDDGEVVINEGVARREDAVN